MPFLNGRRVGLAEWQAANARPRYRNYTEDGRRVLANPEELTQAIALPDPDIVERPSRTDARALAVVAQAMGLSSDDAAMEGVGDSPYLPPARGEWLTPVTHEPVDVPEPLDEAASAPETGRSASKLGRGATDSPRADRQAAEKAATQFSARIGLPRHRPDRRSQTYTGRHERTVREKAAKLGITLLAADAMTQHRWPELCPIQHPELGDA